ncbi:ABC transporter substrate-binding protein [Amycolatopsis cihanbeyliensis]|uniref:Carbohydrate ABC transporter substrate-binding protein (CUT1 family) n=1 Tax=Amycolatopsis cihanbeyliensis TaxID=1128664 RepID=A0A542DQ93_AMYCI|nr:extracellular solute-binding protein [Amycolatopsis cihanbeyliensis]TQJ05227.1 carbohydrate ABC transporter substrate-binding protein (CUT1 family) [Amycolatopsis cihanbeyliensis]
MPATRRSVLTASLALPLAAGCSAAGTSASAGPVRITFWSALRGSQQVVNAFNRAQKRIHVDFQQIPSGDQGGYAKLSTAARAGNAPDVATIEYPQVPGFAIDGVARDITDLVSDRLRAKLLPRALGLTTFAGRVFTVPLDVEPMVLHYRTDLFAELGLAVPRTWDEFAAAARRVRDARRRIALFPTDGALQFAAFAWQAGAGWFDTSGGAWNLSLTDGPTRRVAGYWQQLIDDGLVFANASLSREHDAQIGQGRVLARLSGAWDAGAQMTSRPGQRGKWAVAPLPRWDLAHPAVGTHGGSTFAVTRDSAHPEAAMEFIEWQVTHPDALRARLSSGTSSQYPAAPALVDVGRRAFDRSYYGGQDIYRVFEEEAAKIRDGWMWGPRMSATQRVLQDGFARAGAGQGTLLGAVRDAQRATMADLAALGLATTTHGG